MAEAFRIAAADGHHAASAYAAGHLGLNASNLRRLLARRVYLGEVHHETAGVNLKAHERLTDQRTWDAAQTTPRFRARPATYPLSGVLTCGGCGQPMSGQTVRRPQGDERRYRCGNHRGTRRPSHLDRGGPAGGGRARDDQG